MSPRLRRDRKEGMDAKLSISLGQKMTEDLKFWCSENYIKVSAQIRDLVRKWILEQEEKRKNNVTK